MIGYLVVCYSLNFILGEKSSRSSGSSRPSSSSSATGDNNNNKNNNNSKNNNDKQSSSTIQSLIDKWLEYCSIAHNFNMMFISLVCMLGLIYEVSRVYLSHGIYDLICDPRH